MNNKMYSVKWTHSSVDTPTRTTLCEIFDDSLPEFPITYAWSSLSKKDKDKFSRRFGRRLSFQRALIGSFTKEERTAIWKYALTYFITSLIDN